MQKDNKIIYILKKQPIKTSLFLFCIILFAVVQVWNSNAPLLVSEWNEKEISKITVIHPDDFSFAVFGDNKSGYSVFDAVLHDINNKGKASFVIALGDLVPKGKRGYFRIFLSEVQDDLGVPLVTARGNHDADKGSPDNYLNIFGKAYYSFSVAGNYFIVLDAASEFGLDENEYLWLEKELKTAQMFKNRFVFMHVPPFDPTENEIKRCLNDGKKILALFRHYKVTHLFASHIHGHFSGVLEGVPYTITGGAGGELQGEDSEHYFHHYVIVHINQDKVDTKIKRIDDVGMFARVSDFVEDSVLEWGLLFPAGIFLLLIMFQARKK